MLSTSLVSALPFRPGWQTMVRAVGWLAAVRVTAPVKGHRVVREGRGRLHPGAPVVRVRDEARVERGRVARHEMFQGLPERRHPVRAEAGTPVPLDVGGPGRVLVTEHDAPGGEAGDLEAAACRVGDLGRRAVLAQQ